MRLPSLRTCGAALCWEALRRAAQSSALRHVALHNVAIATSCSELYPSIALATRVQRATLRPSRGALRGARYAPRSGQIRRESSVGVARYVA